MLVTHGWHKHNTMSTGTQQNEPYRDLQRDTIIGSMIHQAFMITIKTPASSNVVHFVLRTVYIAATTKIPSWWQQ